MEEAKPSLHQTLQLVSPSPFIMTLARFAAKRAVKREMKGRLAYVTHDHLGGQCVSAGACGGVVRTGC